MSNTENAVRELLLDAFGRIRGLVEGVTNGLDLDAATYRPDAQANSISWLVWHLTRIQDDHIADVAGVEQAWLANGWQQRFDLPFEPTAHGYGQSAADVAAVRIEPAELSAYHADVHALTCAFLEKLEAPSLSRVVDENWDPPVTMSVRLVSVVSDCLQHLGQAAYLRGLVERR